MLTATDNFKFPETPPLNFNPWNPRFSWRAPVLLQGLQRFRELPSQISRFRSSIGFLSIGHRCVDTSDHFIKRSKEFIRTHPLAHCVQNRSTVPLKISPRYITPQAFAHIAVLQPIQHRIPDRPRLDEGFVRRRGVEAIFNSENFFPTHGDVVHWIRAEDHRLNANEHGKDAGSLTLPLRFRRTWEGVKEAQAYCLGAVSRRCATNFVTWEELT